MSAADSWFIVVVGYAIMLAWPVSTLALVSFAVRYVAGHTARKNVENGTPEHFWIIVPTLNEASATVASSSARYRTWSSARS
jgi:1,2-diacylglycerol 3-beta-glucosyltransferase